MGLRLMMQLLMFTLLYTLLWSSSSSLVEGRRHRTHAHTQQRENATIRVRVTNSALNFFSDIGHHVVEYEVRQIEFPAITFAITGGPGVGQVNVTDLKIDHFESPKFKFKLAPPSGIAWVTRDGAVQVEGNWMAMYKMLLPVYLSGYVKASASDIRLSVQADAYVSKGRPQIGVDGCAIDVDTFEIEVGGGVIPWVVNLFRSQLAYLVKQSIHNQLCKTVETVLLDEANTALMSMPTRIAIAPNLYVNYNCKSNPVATTSYVEGEVYSTVVYRNKSCRLPTVTMDEGVENSTTMAHFWVSEHIPNCLLESAHTNGILNYVVTKDAVEGRLKTFMSTSCYVLQVCIGKLFPKLREKYPNQFVDFRLLSAVAPVVSVTPSAVSLTASIAVNLYISPWRQQTEILAELEANVSSLIMPALVNRTITGDLLNISTVIREKSSSIGHFNEKIFKFVEQLITPVLTVFIRSLLKVGVHLPLIDNVTLADDAVVVPRNGFLRIDADFQYI